jgi:PAS domain S-box-containing protein
MGINEYINIGEVFGAISAIIAGTITAYNFVLKPIYSHFSRIAKLMMNVDSLVADLKPNGGSSLKDQINRIEHRLIRGEMRSRALIRDYDCGIFECDMDGNNIFVNRTYCKMIGVPAPKLLGREWEQFMHPKRKNEYDMLWTDRFENCEEVCIDTAMVTAAGDVIDVRIKAYPLKDDTQTRCVGYFGMVFSHPEDI